LIDRSFGARDFPGKILSVRDRSRVMRAGAIAFGPCVFGDTHQTKAI
jgi:hypothetical protein